jgi:phosphatidylserine decarboxylase
MCDKLSVYIQYLLPQHLVSRFAGLVANCRWRWLKNKIIKNFIKKYKVEMSIAVLELPEEYPTFNNFFIRHLKPEARPLAKEPLQIVSPVDGCVSQIGRIRHHTLLQAKGATFDLLRLLGGSTKMADLFYNGNFATFYLSPRDYHRVHMPLSGTLKETLYIPGKLFSVNLKTTQYVPELFARNERLVCLFDTDAGPMIVIMIGAMLVASINTVWPQKIDRKTIVPQTFSEPFYLEKGAELGYFTLGSTVMVLFAKDSMRWQPDLQENSQVYVREFLGLLRDKT